MTFHARQTNTLLHFEKTYGESGTSIFRYFLVDEDGNQYVDESDNPYVTYDIATVQVLHAKETNTIFHCE